VQIMADERPRPEPRKLLAHWMEWESGDSTPGRVLADLKKAGMRDLLEEMQEEPAEPSPG
jgi:hypothetical protein